jgi:hypothetical protein
MATPLEQLLRLLVDVELLLRELEDRLLKERADEIHSLLSRVRDLRSAVTPIITLLSDRRGPSDRLAEDFPSSVVNVMKMLEEVVSVRRSPEMVGGPGDIRDLVRRVLDLAPNLRGIDSLLRYAVGAESGSWTVTSSRRAPELASVSNAGPKLGVRAGTRSSGELEPTMERLPRYANAALVDARSGRRLDRKSSLQPGGIARLRLDIGRRSTESQVAEPIPLPDLPKDLSLDVMVSSTDFAVARTRSGLDGATVAQGRFFLAGDGSPATTPRGGKFLVFYLKAPDSTGTARCRIGYYYRNVLVQSQQLIAAVGRHGGFKFETDFTVSADLTNLESIPERPRISVLTNSNGNGLHQIVLRSPDPGSASGRGETFQIKEATVGETIRQLRATLTERAPTAKRRRRADFEEDLRALAQHGWTLYTQVPAQRTHMFQPILDNPEGFVVQVLRPTSSAFVFPWALIYDIPLNSNRPEVCRLVSQWKNNEPLITGLPRECPHGPHGENVLCPFGFWGFRYAIEQLSSSDKPVVTIQASGPFDFVVAQTQYDVDLKALEAHIEALRATLRTAFPDAQIREGKDKKTIKELLGHDLPFVYFYCHGEQRNIADPDTWLGIGNREIITAKEFIGWVVSWQRILKKLVWNEVRPLVFVNACHSLAIYPETLVSYLDAFVGTAHAAGVIGTEVRVSQELAVDVAMQFFGLLLSKKHSVDSALRTIRLDYLASGNLFGLVYTPYCWADLRIA